MSAAPLEALTEAAFRAAVEAGALVKTGFRSRIRVEEKAPRDLVTEFDRASEALLFRRLAEAAPGVPAIGEEHAVGGTSPRPGLVWCVDPLDGTTNFVHGHPFWCISIGLLEDDVPVAGVVVAPLLDLSWRGFCPRGARAGDVLRNGDPCGVSATRSIDEAMIATGFPPVRDRAPANNFDAFVAVKRRAQAVRRCGSAAIDLCMVADGTYDAYWERRLHVWDVAAGAALVRAAGGAITSLDGGHPDYHTGHLIASNGLIHASLVELLRGSQADKRS